MLSYEEPRRQRGFHRGSESRAGSQERRRQIFLLHDHVNLHHLKGDLQLAFWLAKVTSSHYPLALLRHGGDDHEYSSEDQGTFG